MASPQAHCAPAPLPWQRPDLINRLVLAAFTYTGEGSPTLADRAKQVEFYRTHNRRPRDRDMIRSIFTRDKPGTSDPAVGEALADAEMKFGNDIPTGTYLDMTANLPIVDPLKIHSPLLIVRGEFDGIATEVDLINFYTKLTVFGPAIHHPARAGAFSFVGNQSSTVLARDAGVSGHAAAP